MREFELCLIDDETEITGTLRTRFSLTLDELEPAFKILSFNDLESAKVHLEQSDNLAILVLDHDFPASTPELQTGYDLASWVKRSFWTRHFTPIIYFTGRESKAGFDEQSLALGISAPDFYFAKSRSFDESLEELIALLHTRLCNFEDTLDQHGFEIALAQFTSLGWEL